MLVIDHRRIHISYTFYNILNIWLLVTEHFILISSISTIRNVQYYVACDSRSKISIHKYILGY